MHGETMGWRRGGVTRSAGCGAVGTEDRPGTARHALRDRATGCAGWHARWMPALLLVATLAAGAITAAPARAQVGASPGQGSAPLPPAPPERIEPAPTVPRTSDGVLRPPAAVDPGIRTIVPDPNLSSTPVIPPPGTPGGNQTVRPR